MKRHWINFLWVYAAVLPTVLAAQSGAAPAPANNSRSFPPPLTIKGKPIESRPPEKSDNKPAFPEQTRAPYHPSAPFQITTLIDSNRPTNPGVSRVKRPSVQG